MNPYKIQGPALISFSGGRTSAYMLYHILQVYNGKLPEDVWVVFANTGKERPETLDFVEQCSLNWNVPIHWLEYRYEDNKNIYTEVNHLSASRLGEPFNDLIKSKQFLPNPVMRFCTIELKIIPMKKFMAGKGFKSDWDCIIGLRADEPRRAAKALNNQAEWTNIAPLHTANVTESDVLGFWKNSDFDLQLTPDESNCDLCFLKGVTKLENIIRPNPYLANWWIERESGVIGTKGLLGRFRSDRPPYKAIKKRVIEQGTFSFMDDNLGDCFCGD